jgi:hypothetical protein
VLLNHRLVPFVQGPAPTFLRRTALAFVTTGKRTREQLAGQTAWDSGLPEPGREPTLAWRSLGSWLPSLQAEPAEFFERPARRGSRVKPTEAGEILARTRADPACLSCLFRLTRKSGARSDWLGFDRLDSTEGCAGALSRPEHRLYYPMSYWRLGLAEYPL